MNEEMKLRGEYLERYLEQFEIYPFSHNIDMGKDGSLFCNIGALARYLGLRSQDIGKWTRHFFTQEVKDKRIPWEMALITVVGIDGIYIKDDYGVKKLVKIFDKLDYPDKELYINKLMRLL